MSQELLGGRPAGGGISASQLRRLLLALVLACLPALVARGLIAQVSALHALALEANPFLQPDHAIQLYIATPAVVISSFVLFLAPGLLLVLATNRVGTTTEWTVLGFGASMSLAFALGTGTKLLIGSPLQSRHVLVAWLTTIFLGWLLVVIRYRRGHGVAWPFWQPADTRRILWGIGATGFGVILLLPKLFWENFNLDGIEAFEFGRSLSHHLLPHWELQDGVFGFYQNFVLFAYPNHWFISLFGPVEAAARLPFLLYVVVLFNGLILLIEHRQKRTLVTAHEAAVWLGLALFVVVQAFNTSYDPFFADLAEMAATDTLWITTFVLAIYALWSDRPLWFWLFALMTYTASPGGILLLGSLAVVTLIVRSENWRKQMRLQMAALSVCLIIALAYSLWYKPLFIGEVNDQFSAFNLLRRLYPPTLTQVVRLNALIFPSGILPALSMFAVRRNEPYTLIITLVTLLFFFFIYIQAWTSLHQFTPIMILPLVVFWRKLLNSPNPVRRWSFSGVVALTALSLFLSLPRHFQINHAVRDFGLATKYEIGDYENDYEGAARGAGSLYALLPEEYRLQYPEQPWGTDAFSWIFYATREKPADQAINYVVQSASAPQPAGAINVMSENGISVYVVDEELWQRDRERRVERVVVSPIYEPILRHTYQFFRAYASNAAGE